MPDYFRQTKKGVLEMTRAVLDNKFESLRKCIERMESKRPLTQTELETNVDLQDIISINLERAVQICVDIAAHIISDSNQNVPATMVESFSTLEKLGILSAEVVFRMEKAVGFRNIALHEYEKMNWSIVYQIVTRHLNDFREFAKQIDLKF